MRNELKIEDLEGFKLNQIVASQGYSSGGGGKKKYEGRCARNQDGRESYHKPALPWASSGLSQRVRYRVLFVAHALVRNAT